MRDVVVSGRLDRRSPDEVYGLVAKFEDYPKYGNAILGVSKTPLAEPGHYAVDWEVKFQNGILRWSEEDRFDPAHRVIQFKQTAGDIDEFFGSWQFSPDESGTQVLFKATFDLGIPSLSEFLEPVAGRLLVENIKSVLTGFFGDEMIFTNPNE
jgi:ribosome-associated toxin RatA of RatAB toxin-antitoxin module